MVAVADLKNYDFIFAIDKSGSMSTRDVGGKSRWQAMKEGCQALVNKITEWDPDGIEVLLFDNQVRRYDNVANSAKIDEIWNERDPGGGTDTELVLRSAADIHFSRKGQGRAGTIVLVATDGESSNPQKVIDEIISISKRLDKDEELAFSFVQVGNDPGATAFLKLLDDNLVSKGAKFDIVDTKTFDEVGNLPMNEVLIQALTD